MHDDAGIRPGTSEPSALDEDARQVIAAAIEVHRRLGPGFIESVYERALAFELELRAIPFQRQAPIAVGYRGQRIGVFKVDLLIAGRLIVELKAVESLTPIHTAQVISYLKAANRPLALLINFNSLLLLREG